MKKMTMALAALLCAAALAGAQQGLSLDEAVRAALDSNASLSQARIDLEAARRAVGISWNGLVPSLSLGAGTSKPNDGKAASFGSAQASLTLSSALLSAGEKARLAYEAEALAYETAERDLELSVRKAFYSIGLSRKNIALIERNIESARKSYDQAEAKRKAGVAPELDALSAQVTLETLKTSLESAKRAYDDELDSFKVLLGLGGEALVKIEEPAEAELGPVDIKGVKAVTPSVAALEIRLEQARLSLTEAKRAIYSPAVSLGASYQPTYAMESWSDAGSISATASFSLDALMPWSGARSAAASAEDAVAKLESQLAAERKSQAMKIESLERKIAQSRTALKGKRLNEALAQKTYQLTEEAYGRGAKDILSLSSAQDSLAQASLDVSEEAYALREAVLDLEYTLGVPFGTLGR